MAIIPGMEGLEVTVLVSGTPAQEYQSLEGIHLATGGNHHGVKYIEAVPGAPFGICIKKTSAFRQDGHHIGCRLEIDGKQHGFIQERGSEFTGSWTKLSNALIVINEAGQPMRVDHRFGDPQNIENRLSIPEESMNNGCSRAHGYGSIRVDFYRLLGSDGSAVPRQLSVPNAPAGIERASQRDVNGRELSRCIQYPALISNAFVQTPAVYFQDPPRLPFATFEFRYGSKDDLVRAGVVSESAMNSRVAELARALCAGLLST
ncbi:hypothetical protein F4775DRAFT_540640 [Biscogniauxia sp. FL1348]|nr:hypothetical protein F4775DRAFT_540640 [Biscogniauxia sp. FL1348]